MSSEMPKIYIASSSCTNAYIVRIIIVQFFKRARNFIREFYAMIPKAHFKKLDPKNSDMWPSS